MPASSRQLTTLTPEEAKRLDVVCLEFESRWRTGERPRIEDSLKQMPPRCRRPLLRELVLLEVELRRAAGERCTPEEYRKRFSGGLSSVASPSPRVGLPVVPEKTQAQAVGPDPEVARLMHLAAMPEVPGYAVRDVLGEGGMGVVVLADEESFGRPLAMKVLRRELLNVPGAARRFKNEAHVMGRLTHPGVPPVHVRGALPDGRPFFTMKVVRGETLHELLNRRDAPADDLEKFVGIFEQVCNTVGFAHSQGVIHRDLKPANVMVGAFGEVQVMDWGLAKVGGASDAGDGVGEAAGDADTGRAGITQAGAVLGTSSFISPEQARGDSDSVDARSDVFGLGAILCQILTGEPPFNEPSRAGNLRRAAAGDLTAVRDRLRHSGVDSGLVRLGVKCLEADPRRRPADGGAVAAAAAGLREQAHRKLRQAEIAQAQAAGERKRRRLRSVLAVVSGCVLLLALAGVTWQRRIDDKRAMDIKQNIGQAYRFIGQFRFKDAQDQLKEAAGWAAAHGSADLKADVARAGADLRLVQELDGILLDRVLVLWEHPLRLDKLSERCERLFNDCGMDVPHDSSPAMVARCVRESHVNGELIEALNLWLSLTRGDPDRRRWLLDVLSRADTAAGHRRYYDQRLWSDVGKLRTAVARNGDAPLASGLTDCLVRKLGLDCPIALELLRRQQRLRIKDFWINHLYAAALYAHGRYDEAITHFTVCAALRKDTVPVAVGMARCYDKMGDHRMSLKWFQEAARLDPNRSFIRSNIGVTYGKMGNMNAAIRHHLRAVQINPNNFFGRCYLMRSYAKTGQFARAKAHIKPAVKSARDHPEVRYHLGDTLYEIGEPKLAAKHLWRAVRLDHEFPKAHIVLGKIRMDKGEYWAAMEHFTTASVLAKRHDPKWDFPVGKVVAKCEQFIRLEAQMRAVDSGRRDPRDVPDLINLASFCQHGSQRRYGRAVELYRHAFAAEPPLTAGVRRPYRALAAGAAVLAAAGRGERADGLTDADRAELRDQALAWLRADLDQFAAHADQGGHQIIAYRLGRVMRAKDLAPARGPALAELPPAERDRWSRYWSDANALLRRVSPPSGRPASVF